MRLRLYVARSTPNSVRAEHNLSVVLDAFHDGGLPPELEIIDVFSQPKRALTDGVVVTPTLVGLAGDKRVVLMGDLADLTHLRSVLEHLLA
ncbi:MAG: circadian clock KaiB family protein [Hansschlegelia sp.]